MSEELTWDEYCRWQAYWLRFPSDPEAAYQVPAAQITTAIQNANGGKDGKAVPMADNVMYRPRTDDDNFESVPTSAW